MTKRELVLLMIWQVVACTLTARRELVIEWGRRGPADAGPCAPSAEAGPP